MTHVVYIAVITDWDDGDTRVFCDACEPGLYAQLAAEIPDMWENRLGEYAPEDLVGRDLVERFFSEVSGVSLTGPIRREIGAPARRL